MKRCMSCDCLAFDTDDICRKCGATTLASVSDEEISLRDGILMVGFLEKNAPYDEKRCLSLLMDIVPSLQKERIMLGTAFNCGAIDMLRNGDEGNARQRMSEVGMSTDAINVVLAAYGFEPVEAPKQDVQQSTPIPIATPTPMPTPTPVPTPPAPTPPVPTPIPSPPQQTPPGVPAPQSTPTSDSPSKGLGTSIVIMALALIIAIGFLVAQNTPSAKQESTSDTQAADDEFSLDNQGQDRGYQGLSSPIANLINGGHMGGNDMGDFVYAEPISGTNWTTKSLVRTDSNGGNQSTIYTAPNSTENLYHLNVIDDRVVFNQVIEHASSVVSVNVNGGDVKTLDSCDDWSLCQVYDGWVYYRKNGMLCRCDMDGNYRTTLCDVGTNTLWRIVGNEMYYFDDNGDSKIHVSRIDGSNSSIVYHASNGHKVKNAYPVGDDRLVILEQSTSGEDYAVRLFTIPTGASATLISDTPNIERVCSYPDGVIATQRVSDGNYRIFSASYSGQGSNLDVAIRDDAEVRYTCYINNMILFGEISKSQDCSVRGFAMEGGGILTYS